MYKKLLLPVVTLFALGLAVPIYAGSDNELEECKKEWNSTEASTSCNTLQIATDTDSNPTACLASVQCEKKHNLSMKFHVVLWSLGDIESGKLQLYNCNGDVKNHPC